MGIFSKIFGGNKLEAPVLEIRNNHLAFILLEGGGLPSEDEILKSFEKYSQGNHQLTITKDENASSTNGEDEEILSLDIQGIGFAFLAHMPAPIPNGEAEANFQFSISSFSEGSELKSHVSHVMVTLMISKEASPLDAMMAFTSLLAAVTETTESVGVYWGNAVATHTKDFFLSASADHDINPRILLWNGISRSGESGGKMSFLSYGMSQLALPDLYLVCDSNAAGDYLGRFFDLLSYIAGRGKSIPAGDTIGATNEERILVEYVKSPADHNKIVWKVVF